LSAHGYRLGILSNVDDELLAGTLAAIDVRFDLLVTAQQVRSYKPATPHFEVARERIGNARWLHAAQSYFHDVVPAAGLGIAVAWVNRKRESPSAKARADHEMTSMAQLAEQLC
jgi:FMN phosphatase YigB (HAD superfamily)